MVRDELLPRAKGKGAKKRSSVSASRKPWFHDSVACSWSALPDARIHINAALLRPAAVVQPCLPQLYLLARPLMLQSLPIARAASRCPVPRHAQGPNTQRFFLSHAAQMGRMGGVVTNCPKRKNLKHPA